MSQKWCSRCKEEKPLDDFGQNRTTKDGFQKWCSACMREYMAIRRSNELGISAKQIRDSLKIQEFGKALIRHRGVAYKAYKEISNCETDSSAAAACNSFLRTIKFPEQFLAELKSPNVLNSILDYYWETMENGTRTEKRDAIRIVTQINGLWKEDGRNQTPQVQRGLSPEEREKQRWEIWKLITTGEALVEANGGEFKEPPPMPLIDRQT